MIVIALMGFILDQATKTWAFATPSVLVTEVLARNEGTVANLGSDYPMTSTICAVNGLSVLGMMAWWFHRRPDRWRWHEAVFVGILSAGILGNSVDRLALGCVRDFLSTTLYPNLIFNLADLFIVLGFLLSVGSWAVSRLGRSNAAGSRGRSST
jgi:lipoprotein signal peptidase